MLKDGINQIVDMNQVRCRTDNYNTDDALSQTTPLHMNNAVFPGIETFVLVNGVDSRRLTIYDKVLSLRPGRGTGPQVTMNVQGYIKLKPYPTNPLIIRSNMLLAEFFLNQTNSEPGCAHCGPYRWRIYAANDATYTTTSCTINNNQAIDIVFPTMATNNLTASAENNAATQKKTLSYKCDGSASQKIAIKLVSDSTAFSYNFIKTSNNNIGVAMARYGAIVPPNRSFTTSISNGQGQDEISFTLVKNNIAASNIATGKFRASASLIFDTP